MSRRNAVAVTLATTAVLLLAAPRETRAQNKLDAERFKPGVTHDSWVNGEGSAVRTTADPWELAAFLNYGRNSLVSVDSTGAVVNKVISGRMGFDVIGSVTLAEPFAVGIGLPFFILQTGDASPSFAGLGDVRIVPKLRILDDVKAGIGLALTAELRAPTHAGDFSGGTRMPVFAPRLVVDHKWGGGFHLGANGGVTLRERTDYYNIKAASEIAYLLMLGYRFGGLDGRLEIGLEGNGGVGIVAASRPHNPLELFGFFKYILDEDREWQLEGGPAVGLIAGYGVPILRGFIGIRWTPTSHDTDHDGVPDDEDKCPTDPEDRDGVEDADGCADDDADSDGVPDAEDSCPTEKETINGFKDDDGCPDEGPAKVIVEQGRIKILEQVHFETGSSKISEDSNSILNQVALTMKANKQIKRVRVDGHTDDTGARDTNVRLSKERAASVRDYLVRKGVAPSRLKSEGYGPDRPIAKGHDEDSRAENRRVEFIVEQ